MGHDFITFRNEAVHLHDLVIWTLRHFFLREIQNHQPSDFDTDTESLDCLKRSLEGWNRLGPGVFYGTDLTEFVQDEEDRRLLLVTLFRRTIESLRHFGDTIPQDYLEKYINSKTAGYTSGCPTERIILAVQKLSQMVESQ